MFYILVEESKIKWEKENKDKAGENENGFQFKLQIND